MSNSASAAAAAVESAAAGGGLQNNVAAIGTFLAFMAITLAITWWASNRNKTRSDYYTAGGGIGPFQNAVAIAGDFLSAASLLGITSLLYFQGFDATLLIVCTLVAWPLILLIVAERLRNLGQFTFIDVIAYRLQKDQVRPWIGLSAMVVIILYLVAQLLAGGKLIELLFGLNFIVSVSLVTVLMMIYVLFGGMLATTWVQSIKAVLLFAGGAILSALALNYFGWDLARIFSSAGEHHAMGMAVLAPGGWLNDPIAILSVALTGTFGFLGMPHLLMRFFTVRDAAAARMSAVYSVTIIGIFYLFIIIIGFAAITIILGDGAYHDASGALIGGRNMVALHVSHFLGGQAMLGFLAAITFATILAVIAGLTLAGAATIAHDIAGSLRGRGTSRRLSDKGEVFLSKVAVIGLGVVGILFSILFEKQNVVFLTNLSSSVAASVNAPLLLLAIYWKGLTTRGAIAGIIVGLSCSLILIALGPDVMVTALGYSEPIYPYVYPTVVSAPLALFTIWAVSKLDHSVQAQGERDAFDEQLVRSELGVGISAAKDH